MAVRIGPAGGTLATAATGTPAERQTSAAVTPTQAAGGTEIRCGDRVKLLAKSQAVPQAWQTIVINHANSRCFAFLPAAPGPAYGSYF